MILLRNLSLLFVLAIVFSTVPVIRGATQFVTPTQWGGSTSFGPYPSTIQLSQSFNITVHAEWYGLDNYPLCAGTAPMTCISKLTVHLNLGDDSGYKPPPNLSFCYAIHFNEGGCSEWFITDISNPCSPSCIVTYPPDTGHYDVTFHIDSLFGIPGYQYRDLPISKAPTHLFLWSTMDAVVNGYVVGMFPPGNGASATIKVSMSGTQSSTSDSLTSSTISGTVRCGGGCASVGLVYGEPIDVAGNVYAQMSVEADPYTGYAIGTCPIMPPGQPSPVQGCTNAQASFDPSAHGHYELQGLEPGWYSLYASANGFPTIFFAANVTVKANQNLSIDAYVCTSSGFVNGFCSQPSTSTAQVSLTPSTTYTYSATSNALTSYTPYTNPSTPSAITSTSSLQMPTQPSLSQGQNWFTLNNYVAYLVFLAVVGAVAIFMIWNHGRPSKRSRPSLLTDYVTSKPAAPRKKKTAAKTESSQQGKAFCVNCGKELPAEWKFCRHCGTKQP